MRKLLLATTMLVPFAANAETIEATSTVSRVTVYTDGATIARTLSVSLPAGTNTLVLRSLPAGLDTNSIRVTGTGNAALGIASVDTKPSPGDARPVVDATLEKKLEALRADRDSVAGAIDAAEGQKASITRFGQASPERLGTEGKPLEIERWTDAWRAVGRGLADINESLRALRDKSKALSDDIAALERARPQTPRPGAPKRDVFIALDSAAAAKADLTVTYQVPGAGWTPTYDARLVTTGDRPKLDLVRRASVQQRSGEDWSGVTLALSTLRMRRGTAAPDLSTETLVLIDPFAEMERSASRVAPARARSAAESADLARPASPAPMVAAGMAEPKLAAAPILASVDAGAYEATFTVPGTVDVPQDGTVKSFVLASRAIEPALGARTTPVLDPTAYLEAVFVNDDTVPLLPGDVTLGRDDTFVGRGRVALVPPGEKVRLGFGADDRIKVLRVPVTRKESDPVMGSMRGETQDFRTIVKNGHTFAMRITLVDRLPVSASQQIAFTPLSTNTPPTEKIVDDKPGVSGWTYDYKPGEQREMRLGWQARWPVDRELRRQ